jgi:hypothetical protein
MTRIQHFVAATVTVAAMSAGAAAAQTPEQAKGADQPLISLIGCVERVMPPPPPPGTPPAGATSSAPAFKLIDVQPGSGVKQKPMTPATEYFVVGPESIAFSKFQNQWVEVTGRVFVAALSTPPTTPPVARGEKAPPPATFTVSTIKMISSECKQRR